MFFTREDILKIQQALLQLGVKDSELPSAEPVTYNDTLSIIQDGKNKQIGVKDFFNQISLWKREDFLNITDRYDEHYIMLLEAINLVPTLQRKDGLVITFQDTNGDWRIYQFRGNITEFLNEEKWFDLYDYKNYIIKSFLPDEEDITALTPDENGNSFLALKDRIYDPAIFNGKGYKFVRKNIINVELATIKISVINPTTLEGDIYFNINNKGTKVHLSPTIHNTTKLVSEAIKDALVIAYNDYEVTVANSVVTLIRKYSGSISPTTFEMYNTGVKVIVEDSTTINERNIITQEDINKADTIYEIRYDFNLDGKTIIIPKNCILYFTSGKFYNGSINMDNTIISTLYEDVLLEVNISGNYYNIQKNIKDANTLIQGHTNKLNDAEKNIERLDTRSTQMEETIKDIAATGGASQATAVTYNNEKSKLTAVNIQSAVDEVVDKTAIKNEEGTVVETPFRYIQNEEFIKAIVDSDDKVLFGFYRATGKPYYPLNEMYHVEQNEEFFAVWLDADDKILLGIRRDGQIIGEIHAVNALKKVVSQLQSDVATLQEKVGTIDTNLKELLDVFSFQDSEEYLAVEQDAEGKVLSATNPDGSHYIHNAKSETIPEEFYHIEDLEGRTEITTDAEDKILGYRDSEGTRHEHKISAKHLELSREAANEVNDAFKSAGIKMENPSDFSKDSHIELPIPRIAAQVRLYAPKLPTTKHDDIEAVIEYIDKDGNYFHKPVILNAQGSSSMSYYVKNMAIDINDGSEIKFGDFPTQDSFHLKKYYIDAFRGQCIVGYWLMEQVYKSRPIGQQYPYDYSIANDSVSEGFGSPKKDFFTGAKCHPDGFPINITWISNDGTETDMGIYAWNLKKSKEVYYADKKKAENIILDGEIATDTLFGGTIKWSSFEIRNPKSLIDINGNKYDGDNPTELSDTDPNSKKVKDYLISLSKVFSELNTNKTKDVFEKHFLINPFIDYCLVSDVLYHIDGFRKNWIWLAYNGKQFTPSLYDVDSIFGSHFAGLFTYPNSETTKGLPTWVFPCNILYELYKDDIDARYKVLRDLGIFTVDNIMSLLNKWLDKVGYYNYSKEFSIYNETPSYRKSPLNSEYWKIVNWAGTDTTYDKAKTYSVGEKCIFNLVEFECVKENAGQEPTLFSYSKNPNLMGFYNSPIRVKNWLIKKIETLDTYYNYQK